MTIKRTIRQWRICTGIPVAALMMCAALVTGCSQDDDPATDGGEPVAVSFTASMDGAALPSGASRHTELAGNNTRSHAGYGASTAQEFTGVTDAGVPYRDYTDADGFATRGFYPGSASRHTETARTSSHAGATTGFPKTRTTTDGSGNTQWVQDDPVGIFMLTAGGSLPGITGADNRLFKVSDASTGALTPGDGGAEIYYPQSDAVDFVAYYPYRATPGNDAYIYKVSVADQSDPAAINVLYAKKPNAAKSKTAVNLEFGHVMSMITLNVKAGDGISSGDIQSLAASDVKINGMPLTAELALQDGNLTPGTAGLFSPLKASTAQSGYDATFPAIVVPQPTGVSGRTVVFTVGGTPYTWTIPPGDVFAAGNHYTYPVTVQKSGITVGNPTITKWGENDNGTGQVETPPVGTVLVPAGTFQMGSPASEPNRNSNETQHEVTLTQDFYMSRYQVTKAQFTAFLNAVGVGQDGKYDVKDHGVQTLFSASNYGWTPVWDDGTGKWVSQGNTSETHPDDVPMIQVTWYGAKAYADWAGCRLPTEAQWEYACRAGTTTAYSFGDDAAKLGDYAWYYDNSYGTGLTNGPGVVGTKLPNRWGLYDMHGNVFEWCSDWYGSYGYGPDTDPAGPTAGNRRVLRGGSWFDGARFCRSAYRDYGSPGNAGNSVGFRVVFVSSSQP